MDAVALTVAPGGQKMQRDSACDNQQRPLDPLPMIAGRLGMLTSPVKDPPCGTIAVSDTNGGIAIMYHGVSMRLLASSVSRGDRPVVDRTQLEGAYDFTLTSRQLDTTGFTSEQIAEQRAQVVRDQEREFQKQLGLKINFSKVSKLPVRVLVVDQVEKPTAN